MKNKHEYITIEEARRMIAGVDDFDASEYERIHLLRLAASIRAAANAPGVNLANLARTADHYIDNHKGTKHAAEFAALVAARNAITA